MPKDLKIFNDSYFREWIKTLKQIIKQSQLKAAIHVNSELLQLYWDIGKEIVQRDIEAKWGSKIFATIYGIFIGLFVFNSACPTWIDSFAEIRIDTFLLVISLTFSILLAITPVFVKDPRSRCRLFIVILGQIPMLGSLLFTADALRTRAFFLTYALFAITACLMLEYLVRAHLDQAKTLFQIRKISFESIIIFACIGLLFPYLMMNIKVVRVCQMRESIISTSLRQGDDIIYIPSAPDTTYHAGSRISPVFLSDYKRIYNIPENIEIEVLDIAEWATKRLNISTKFIKGKGLQICWPAQNGVMTYSLYRCNSNSGDKELVAEGLSTRAIDANATKNKQYHYLVYGYDQNGKQIWASDLLKIPFAKGK